MGEAGKPISEENMGEQAGTEAKSVLFAVENWGVVQEHVKAMTEIFEGLSVIGDPILEEDRVVHLLASLPDSYNMQVTAFEANVEVPKFEVVTERLLHEERKLKERADIRGRSNSDLKRRE